MSERIARLGLTSLAMIGALTWAPGCGGGSGAATGSGGSLAGGSGAGGGSGGALGSGAGGDAAGGIRGEGGGGGSGGAGGSGGMGGGAGTQASSSGGAGGSSGAGAVGLGGAGDVGGSGAGAAGLGGAGGGAGAAGHGDGGAGAAGGAVNGGTGGGAGSGGQSAGTAGGAGSGGGIAGCSDVWTGDIQIGTALDDEITAVTAAPSGGFYVTGYEHGDVSASDVIPGGDAVAVIVRYDAAGVPIWKTTIDTPGADTAEDVQVDAATGNLVVLGRTTGSLPGFQNAGQMDIYVSVLDAGGGPLGAIQFGDDRPQHPARLALGPNRKILIAGYDDIFIPTNYVAALPHGFLAELTGGSAPTFAPTEDFWHRSAYFDSPPPPPSVEDFTTGVAVDAAGDGAPYVASTVNGRVDQRGMFLTKLDASGQTIWSTRLSRDAGDYLSAVALRADGDLFVAGAASVEVAGVEVGQQDAFVAKVDKMTGAVLWATLPSSPESDFPTAMTFDRAGNVYVTGETLGTIAGGAPNQGGIDIFVVKIGPSGGILSSWQRGSAGDDIPAGIAVDTCGRVFVGGFTTGALVAGQSSAGGRDAFIVKSDLR